MPTIRTLLVVIAMATLTGCAIVPYRAHPEAGQRLPAIKKLALLPPDVKVYSLSAGGVPELMDDWSARGRLNVGDAIKQTLGAGDTGYTVSDFTPEPTDTRLVEHYEDVRALVDAVRSAVILHTYRPSLTIQEKRENFRFSVGPVRDLAEAAGADALVFVSGVDHISTAGRKALMGRVDRRRRRAAREVDRVPGIADPGDPVSPARPAPG